MSLTRKTIFQDAWYKGGDELLENAEVYLEAYLEDDGERWLVHIEGPGDQMVTLDASELLAVVHEQVVSEVLL